MNSGEDPGLGAVCGGLLAPLPASQGLPMPCWLVNLPLEWKAVPYWPMCDRIASSGFEKQENRKRGSSQASEKVLASATGPWGQS